MTAAVSWADGDFLGDFGGSFSVTDGSVMGAAAAAIWSLLDRIDKSGFGEMDISCGRTRCLAAGPDRGLSVFGRDGFGFDSDKSNGRYVLSGEHDIDGDSYGFVSTISFGNSGFGTIWTLCWSSLDSVCISSVSSVPFFFLVLRFRSRLKKPLSSLFGSSNVPTAA